MAKTTNQMDAELARLFSRFDVNNDNYIDKSEFGLLLHALGEVVPPKSLTLHFEIIDTNGDGVVDYKEFVDWWLDYKV